MSESKRFEDYPMPVDCNECESYWDNSCDGTPRGTERRCNSFSATRSVVIPAQIKSLQSAVLNLRIQLLMSHSILLLHLLMHLFGGV